MATIQEAQERGYLRAKRISVAHVDKIITLPTDVILVKDAGGNIKLCNSTGKDQFPDDGKFSWTGIVYEEYSKRWSTIIEYRKEDLTGRYIKVLKKCLGGATSKYEVGDYLKILSKGTVSQNVYTVEHAGSLLLTPDSGRIINKEVEIMPEGFDPNVKLGTVNNFPKLDKFPEGGVCWNPTKQLYDYLILRTTASPLPSVKEPYKALAWNSNNIWGVQASSSQPVYDISQLTPFFTTPKEPQKIGLDFMKCPSIDNFEIGKTYYVRDDRKHSLFMVVKCTGINTNDPDRINGPYLSNMNSMFKFNAGDTPWISSGREVCLASEKDTKWLECCIRNNKFIELESVNRYPEPLVSEIKVGDHIIVHNPGNPSHGVKGVVGEIFKEDGIMKVELARPLPKYPGGGELFAVPLYRVRHYSDIPEHIKHYPMIPEDCYYPLPDKWCIVVTSYNEDALQEFLEQRSYLWQYYSKDWKVGPRGTKPNYFHFPPASTEPCHSHWKIQKGYTEITTEQFNQFYQQIIIRQDEHRESKSGQSRGTSDSNRSTSNEHCSKQESIKICRANLTIRPGDTIRATSFRCSKSKINLGG